MPDTKRNGFVKIISSESHSLSVKCKKANAIGFNEPRKRQQIISYRTVNATISTTSI